MAEDQPQFELELPEPAKRAPRRATQEQSAPEMAALDQLLDLAAAEARHQERLAEAAGTKAKTRRKAAAQTADGASPRPRRGAKRSRPAEPASLDDAAGAPPGPPGGPAPEAPPPAGPAPAAAPPAGPAPGEAAPPEAPAGPGRRRSRRATAAITAPSAAPAAQAAAAGGEPAAAAGGPRRAAGGAGAAAAKTANTAGTDQAAQADQAAKADPAAKAANTAGADPAAKAPPARRRRGQAKAEAEAAAKGEAGARAKGAAKAPAGQAPSPVDPESRRPPMTALLFQAPAAVPARPRRAKAEAGTPAQAEPAAEAPAAPPGQPKAEPAAKTPAKTSAKTSAKAPAGKSRRAAKASPGPAEEAAPSGQTASDGDEAAAEGEDETSSRRRRRRSRSARKPEAAGEVSAEGVTALAGSTRLEAKRQRRKDGRESGRRRVQITEAEFLARRESVDRRMVVRELEGRTQIAVLEDGVLVEHYVARRTQHSTVGNVYLGRVQNVLPSMEAAFVDVGKGRNAVLYAGEVNWDAAGLEGQPRRIEQALSSGDSVMVQVTKDPIGHKGARLTSQITLAGRYLVFVPSGGMTGISRKLPDVERARLKKLLKEIVPSGTGVIVRTAAEGASDAELAADVARLSAAWEKIQQKAATASAPALLKGEPDLAIRVVRDIFNEDFTSLTVSGQSAWDEITGYLDEVAPELRGRVSRWSAEADVFAADRIDEQLAKGLDRKVWLPSGGSLVIDRTEAMTVVDVNTGKFTGAGGTLEETVTRNNLEAAEEIVRQLRLRDIGGIIVIDFIDMVLESNRDLVLRRLVEALGRDRTRHQVAEVTSLGLVQMTRKRVGQGLVEVFSETCEACAGRGFIVHSQPVERGGAGASGPGGGEAAPKRKKRGGKKHTKRKLPDAAAPAPSAPPAAPAPPGAPGAPVLAKTTDDAKAKLASIAAAAAASRAQAA
ncbi:MAG: Rne/Rng family ribonuclease [Bifidobacteriaceae bacterium]|nr:Rne/Rng family ribonuclease [Bifidobacteriaceae bacterium]